MFEDAMNWRFAQEGNQNYFLVQDRRAFNLKERKVREDVNAAPFFVTFAAPSRSLRLKSFTCGSTISVVQQTREAIIVSFTFTFLRPATHFTPARSNRRTYQTTRPRHLQAVD
jgi:hypothetical protein